MPLAAGARLGPYEIIAPLGAGGMGEVYRARDSRLDRQVAVKILPAAWAQDGDRLRRFEVEARAAGQLNHPNILVIHDFDQADGASYLVTELLEGETLRQRLNSGGGARATVAAATDSGGDGAAAAGAAVALPPRKALEIAAQIASGLAAAHEKGIVHRDLKPENIFLTADGRVKILDFGLAKLTGRDSAAAGDDAPTLPPGTIAGEVLGTVGYMAPEQVRGRPSGPPADLFALGAILYEMLSGRRAFQRGSAAETMAAIVKEEPPPLAPAAAEPGGSRAALDPALERLVEHCLEKDPAARFQSARDLGFALQALAHPGSTTRAAAIAAAARPRWRGALPWGVAVALAIALAAVILWPRGRGRGAAPVALDLAVPTGQALFVASGPAVVISPDGHRLAYVASTPGATAQIFVRNLDQTVAQPLPGAQGQAPFFSADGRWLAYCGTEGLEKVSVFGGPPVMLAPACAPRGGAWDRDGVIVFTPGLITGLARVGATGGAVTAVAHLAGGAVTYRWPQLLPGGGTALFTASADNNDFSHATVEAVSLATGRVTVLVRNAYFGRYLAAGYLVYFSGSTLFAARFDPRALRLLGPALPVMSDIQTDITDGSAQFSAAGNGTIVYGSGAALTADMVVNLADLHGTVTPLVRQPGGYADPQFAPDGKRLALQMQDNIWIYDLTRSALTQLTTTGCIYPLWTPDGQGIVCTPVGGRDTYSGLREYDVNTGVVQPLIARSLALEAASSWLPNGQALAFMETPQKPDGQGCCEIKILPVGAAGQAGPARLFARHGWEPAFSPDGHWLAYFRQVGGADQVFVTAYPGPGGTWQVSVDRGSMPVWSPTGQKLYFVQYAPHETLESVAYTTRGGLFQPGPVVPLIHFHGTLAATAPYSDYAIAPDGRHFAFLQAASPGAALPHVVLHWFAALRSKLARDTASTGQ